MNKTKVKPLGENVLVSLEKPEKKTAHGIYLPESANEERPQMGKVVAVGESNKIKVKKGQRVIFKLYGGDEVTIDGEKLLIASYKDILAIVE